MFECMWVSADDTHVYPAWVDRSYRWDGCWFASPYFSLETVRRIAADLDEQIARYGYADCEEIRFLDPPGLAPADGAPRPVFVLHISWPFADYGPNTCTRFVNAEPVRVGDGPTHVGYAVASCQWPWHEAPPPHDT